MPGPFQYNDRSEDFNAISNFGQTVGGLAGAMPQLQMRAQEIRQRMALQEAERILRMIQTREAQQRGNYYEAEGALTRQKLGSAQATQQREQGIGDSIRTIMGQPTESPGIEAMTGLPAPSSMVGPGLYGDIAAQQAGKNPADIGQALAAAQYFLQQRQDPMAMFGLATGHAIAPGGTVGTGRTAPYAPMNVPHNAINVNPNTGHINATGPVMAGPENLAPLATALKAMNDNSQLRDSPEAKAIQQLMGAAALQKLNALRGTNAAPAMPTHTATNPQTGQKIQSFDGGASWEPVQQP